MKSHLDVLSDHGNLLEDVVVNILLALVHVFVVVEEPRSEHVDVLQKHVLGGDVYLEGQVFVRDRILDVAHRLP